MSTPVSRRIAAATCAVVLLIVGCGSTVRQGPGAQGEPAAVASSLDLTVAGPAGAPHVQGGNGPAAPTTAAVQTPGTPQATTHASAPRPPASTQASPVVAAPTVEGHAGDAQATEGSPPEPLASGSEQPLGLEPVKVGFVGAENLDALNEF